MSTDDELAVDLTRRIVDTEGVRGIFPESVVGAAVAALVRSDRSSATGLVELKRSAGTVVVTARLAVDVATSSAAIAAGVFATAQQVLGAAPFRLHLEISHID